MGSCFSKKTDPPKRAALPLQNLEAVTAKKAMNVVHAHAPEAMHLKQKVVLEDVAEQRKKDHVDDAKKKNEVFLIEHRRSHEDGEKNTIVSPLDKIPSTVTTSSCTKEEVDAILIHCGRLSRSNSAEKMAFSGSRKYSGSKRSFDFDNENQTPDPDEGRNYCDGDDAGEGETRRDRHRNRALRQHSPSGGSSQGRRRTPSRERDQRSGSKERTTGGRRVSRSPGRRSDSNAVNGNSSTTRPMKMMSVPATVAVDKDKPSTTVDTASAVKGIPVKKKAGGTSPRTMSPARVTGNQQQQTLSRNSSRKAEHSPSPYRRNPLSEIDTNAPPFSQTKSNMTKQESKTKIFKEQQPAEVPPSSEPQGITRSRSGRRSRDLDLIPSSSYTNLLLEDIENFQNAPPSFTLPACLTKACSILEAVADLNSTTVEAKDPFVESEIQVCDDLTEPSFHKYVTYRPRKSVSEEDRDGQESSGSNSVVGGGGSRQLPSWGTERSNTSWDPSSADSTDRWTSRSNSAGLGTERSKMAASHRVNGDGGRGRVMATPVAGKAPTPVRLDTAAVTM